MRPPLELVCPFQQRIVHPLCSVELFQTKERLDAEFLGRILEAQIGYPTGQFSGVIQKGKRLIIRFCLDKTVRENRQEPDLACRVSCLRCKLQGGADVLPGRFQITVIKCRNSKLCQCPVLPLLITPLLGEMFHSLPITPHCPAVRFSVNVALNNEGEHPQFSVGLKKRIVGEVRRQLLGFLRQRALVALDRRPNQTQLGV
ncbi:MAG TPA: hypothetical protein VGG72_03000 [Bryobacteraceae bacterium]